MLNSFNYFNLAKAATAALLLATTAYSQVTNTCGGVVQNGTQVFSVRYFDDVTILTMNGFSYGNESYVLYCGEQPSFQALLTYGVATTTKTFKVPVNYVLARGSYTSTYIEISGHSSNISVIENPENLVSPCLQKRLVDPASLFAYHDVDSFVQWQAVSVGFEETNQIAQAKSVWFPGTIYADPLVRVEFITAMSLFFNDGGHGQQLYDQIKTAFNTLAADMDRIPTNLRNRIAWVYYEFSTQTWRLRNSAFTRGMIKAAGGIHFPLSGDDEQDDRPLSSTELKTVLENAQYVIDQTDFKGRDGSFQAWYTLAGYQDALAVQAFKNKRVYTLDETVNSNGISDYTYRLAARPDIFLKDLIYAQYPAYNPAFNATFLNLDFVYASEHTILTANDCEAVKYNSGDIPNVLPNPNFVWNSVPPPALTGTGTYGAGGSDDSGSDQKGGNKTGTIIAVVCSIVVLGAIFGFVFFKWGKRAKEDRFIELEDEMNNDIPLH
ncbi:hypothetical protein BGZ76_003175 [Entomortierella beljakovae]|nr:hypothetical protein BGZ76_003175 [Entomortierella beljakovae]